jgi:hypothetical protein
MRKNAPERLPLRRRFKQQRTQTESKPPGRQRLPKRKQTTLMMKMINLQKLLKRPRRRPSMMKTRASP